MAIPVRVEFEPWAQATNGLTANNTVDGIGLVTFGWLWSCAAIWDNYDYPRSTIWSPLPGDTGDDC